MKKPARDRQRPLRVIVSAEERAEIERRAAAANLSVSAYLRTVGLGHEPRSVFDHQAVLELAKVNADQGRLGGLLKLWLTERRGEGATVAEVNRVLKEIDQLQSQLRALVGRV